MVQTIRLFQITSCHMSTFININLQWSRSLDNSSAAVIIFMIMSNGSLFSGIHLLWCIVCETYSVSTNHLQVLVTYLGLNISQTTGMLRSRWTFYQKNHFDIIMNLLQLNVLQNSKILEPWTIYSASNGSCLSHIWYLGMNDCCGVEISVY